MKIILIWATIFFSLPLMAQHTVISQKGSKLSPLCGVFFYNVNPSFLPKNQYIRPGLFGGIHVGMALSNRKKIWEVSVRRTLTFDILPRTSSFTVSGWASETLVGVNKKVKLNEFFYLRIGTDVLVSTKPSFGRFKYNQYGIAPFLSIPIDLIELELRAHWSLYPNGAIVLNANNYRLFLTYRF